MQLLNEDCYAVMARMSDNSVDLIYADPPYDYDHFKPGTGGSLQGRTEQQQLRRCPEVATVHQPKTSQITAQLGKENFITYCDKV